MSRTPLFRVPLLLLAVGLAGCTGGRELNTFAPSPAAASFEEPCFALPPEGAFRPDSARVIVEQPPELIGGLEGLIRRVEYPEAARRAGIEGKVCLQFVVNEEGRVENLEVTRSAHALLDEAATAAVLASEFRPGTQRGEAVKVRFSLPVMFRLRGESQGIALLFIGALVAAVVLVVSLVTSE